MRTKPLFLISSTLSMLFLSIDSLPSSAQDAAEAPPKTVFPEIIQLPSLEAAPPAVFIKFRFPGKENTSRIDIVEHFGNRIFRLFEDDNIIYGLYAFEGNPLNDDSFTAYYMNLPKENFPVIYFEFVFDNKTKKFKEKTIMPDGKVVTKEGTFEIAAEIKR